MESPTRQRQLEELDQVELCTRILYQSRNDVLLLLNSVRVFLSASPSLKNLS